MTKKTAALFALAVLLAACAPALRVNHFSGAPKYPPTSPSAVDLLRDEPRRPYLAFAEIRYDPPAGISRGEVDWNLRRKGASIGADALIVEVDTVYRERVWVGPVRAKHNRRARRVVERERIIVAVAIRYR